MPGIPVVIAPNGTPIRAVDSGAPLMTVAANGLGIPITLSDRGTPFIVEGRVAAPFFGATNQFWGNAATPVFGKAS